VTRADFRRLEAAALEVGGRLLNESLRVRAEGAGGTPLTPRDVPGDAGVVP
jgi:hypothetical protein